MGSNAELFAVLAEHGGQRGHHELGEIRDGVLLFFGGMALAEPVDQNAGEGFGVEVPQKAVVVRRDGGHLQRHLFVSDTLRGIDRLSKAGQAEPTDYETLIALENAPKRFGQITVTFKDEDHVLGRVNLEYGDSLDESGYPELPAKEGCAACWSTTKLTDLHLDTVVEAVYTDYITALASIYEREAGRSSSPRDRSATATA